MWLNSSFDMQWLSHKSLSKLNHQRIPCCFYRYCYCMRYLCCYCPYSQWIRCHHTNERKHPFVYKRFQSHLAWPCVQHSTSDTLRAILTSKSRRFRWVECQPYQLDCQKKYPNPLIVQGNFWRALFLAMTVRSGWSLNQWRSTRRTLQAGSESRMLEAIGRLPMMRTKMTTMMLWLWLLWLLLLLLSSLLK